MINILIVSYNDNDINNTIESLIKNSVDETKLRFKVMFIETINLDEKYKSDPRFEIIFIPQNRGVGYSRKTLTQKLPNNEFVLQLDSHHRFIKNWDKELIENYNDFSLINEKVIISTALPSFDGDYFFDCYSVSKINSYTVNGIPKISSQCGEGNKETGLITAHFIFGKTNMFNEIKYKDYWYFFGEEILLSLHAFNNGYKVFNPKKIIGWHRYKNPSDKIERDLKIEKKTSKKILNEIKTEYSEEFSSLIGVDFINFKCSYRNYNVHHSEGFDLIYVLTPNNKKILLHNIDNTDIVKFKAEGFFKGAILINTKDKIKKYFRICL